MTSKPLDQMSTQELKLAWGKRAKDFLVGRKIVDVYYHSEKENEDIFGDMDERTNIKIVFDNGHWITASRVAMGKLAQELPDKFKLDTVNL
jgi:hypothetical protein